MLYDIFRSLREGQSQKWRHYFPVYERHFSRYTDRPCMVWEIGISGGGSLEMWSRYFGAMATVVGIDIEPDCVKYERYPNICVRIGDQADTIFLQALLDEFGPPDILVDDGSHEMGLTMETFRFMYPRMREDGVYLIEDMHTAYLAAYNGGVNKPGTVIEEAKKRVDDLNAAYWGGDMAFANATAGISFYDSIVVYEKMKWAKEHRTSCSNGDTLEGVLRRVMAETGREVVLWGYGKRGKSLEKYLLQKQIPYKVTDSRSIAHQNGLPPERLDQASEKYFVVVTPKDPTEIETRLMQYGYETDNYLVLDMWTMHKNALDALVKD